MSDMQGYAAPEKQRLTIWGFIKGVFKVLIGLSLLMQSLLFLIFLIVMVGLMASVGNELSGKGGSANAALAVPDGAALVINPAGILVEEAAEIDPFEEALMEAYGQSRQSEVEVHSIVKAIRAAADDDRIQALVLDLGNLYIPDVYTSKVQYIGKALDEFSDTGKNIVAVGDYYGQGQYYLASHADKIFLHEYGAVEFHGFGRYRTYHKELLDKLEINSHVFRVGTFKSALEPNLRNDMSPAAKEANTAYLSVMWNNYVSDVEAARDLPAGTINSLSNDMNDIAIAAGGDLATVALEKGLVDELRTREQREAFMISLVGEDEDGESFKRVGYKTYLYDLGEDEDTDADNIAIITAAGTIVDGDQPIGVAAGDRIAKQLRMARDDENVKAVVLRVDSPGGSAFASEIIRAEVIGLKDAGKPVIVSMGSLAASGGYWISANADEIWAAPTTITGSIGIFGYFQTYENTLAKIGVHTDGVGTTDLSPILGAGLGPLPEEYAQIIQANIEHGYERFLNLVSEGRHLDRAVVAEIAEGRVWIGDTASKNGLVDKLGDLDDAIASAAKMADLETYDVVTMSESKTRFEIFLEKLGQVSVRLGITQLPEPDLFDRSLVTQRANGLETLIDVVAKEVEFQNSFNDPNAVYLRCLECEALR
ncbi:MAG: signal peptide peptidase SppA [bacterium]